MINPTPIQMILALAQDIKTLERENEIMLEKLGHLEAEVMRLRKENDTLKMTNDMLTEEIEWLQSDRREQC